MLPQHNSGQTLSAGIGSQRPIVHAKGFSGQIVNLLTSTTIATSGVDHCFVAVHLQISPMIPDDPPSLVMPNSCSKYNILVFF